MENQEFFNAMSIKYFKMLKVSKAMESGTFIEWLVKRKENFMKDNGMSQDKDRVNFWKYITWRKTLGRDLDNYHFKKDEWV